MVLYNDDFMNIWITEEAHFGIKGSGKLQEFLFYIKLEGPLQLQHCEQWHNKYGYNGEFPERLDKIEEEMDEARKQMNKYESLIENE